MTGTECKGGEAGPLFSVVVPTRNRPDVVACAIASVMAQNFSDFELVISDNCDRDDARALTREAASPWLGDPRVRYVSPEKPLNMADHWEFATLRAIGRHVAILTDRHVMRPSTLLRLSRALSANGHPDLVAWNVLSGLLENGLELIQPFSGREGRHVPLEVLQDFLRMDGWGGDMFINLLPRGLNSLYSRRLAAMIRKRCGRMFWPLSPDYTSAFLSLAFADSLLSLELPFYMCHGSQSNGANSMVYGISGYLRDYPEIDPFEGCPEHFDTIINTLVRDFNAVKRLAAPALDRLKADVCGYYLSNYREFLWKEQMGSPLDLAAMRLTWQRGVGALPAEEQARIREGMRRMEKFRPRLVRLRRIALARGWDRLYRNFFSLLRKYQGVLAGRRIYHDVAEAARATDDYLALPPGGTGAGGGVGMIVKDSALS